MPMYPFRPRIRSLSRASALTLALHLAMLPLWFSVHEAEHAQARARAAEVEYGAPCPGGEPLSHRNHLESGRHVQPYPHGELCVLLQHLAVKKALGPSPERLAIGARTAAVPPQPGHPLPSPGHPRPHSRSPPFAA
jgi:hypothetical protein